MLVKHLLRRYAVDTLYILPAQEVGYANRFAKRDLDDGCDRCKMGK